MRFAILFGSCVIACGGDSDSARYGNDAHVDAQFEAFRSARAVIVDGSQVAWSLNEVSCSLESGPDCPPEAATILSSSSSAASMPEEWARTRRGATIVGSANQVFFLNSDDPQASFLVRVVPTANLVSSAVMSTPTPDVSGLAVDTTHVYWSEAGTNGFLIKRALRTGDGSDVEIVTTSPLRPTGLVVFGGYVFVGPKRAAVAGGTLQTFTSETNWGVFAVGPDKLYVEQAITTDGSHSRIASMTADGVFETLVDNVPQTESPAVTGMYDRGELFWATSLNVVYRVPATGGSPGVLSNGVTAAFGLTENLLLYDFSASGYKTLPR